jgi:hypothetical protein
MRNGFHYPCPARNGIGRQPLDVESIAYFGTVNPKWQV